MPTPETQLTQLKTQLAEIADLGAATALLSWDQQCYMPPGSAEGRGYQLATLARLAHVKFTADEVGRLLVDLKPYGDQLDPDSDDARLLRVTKRAWDKQVKVPTALVVEMTQLTANAHNVWAEARAQNDFARFQPYLEKIVDLRRQYAEIFAPYEHIYDPLLDDFEPGLKTADVQAIFNVLRPQQVALLQAITARPQVDASFLHQPFDEQKQWNFGVEIITRMGFDWQHGRQDKTVHPFCTNFGIDDVRITTRVSPNFLNPALFGTIHETGHALYESGIAPGLGRTPLAAGASLGIHESQSRLWENIVGRSLPFWEYFYPRLQAFFPAQFGGLPLETFYKGINKVEPSFIRVEADEATYNLHIMLRLELEIALLEGSVAVKDLPEAWNSRFREYLDLTPPTDTLGVLQDVHWSGGMIGYFATYALGNLISAQLWECIQHDLPDLGDHIRRGEFAALLGWLRENVHRHGAKFEPQELVQRITGSKIDPAAYMRYLQGKYGEVYGL